MKKKIMARSLTSTHALTGSEGRRREEIVTMVQRQAEKWPHRDSRRQFTSKTNMDRMRGVLLNHAFGFTKEVEVVRPLSPTPGSAGTPSQPEPQQDDVEMRGMQDRGDDDDGRCPPPLS
jgi:hypothetical protein